MAEDYVFNEVYDGSEIEVEVGEYIDGNWTYDYVEYRRDFSPDMPDNTRRVYDKLNFKGSKQTRVENNLSLTQEFMGFEEGLFQYGNRSGLLVKVSIVPHQGDAPEKDVKYFYNWSPAQPQMTVPDEGEVELVLEGGFDRMEDRDPIDNQNWISKYEVTFNETNNEEDVEIEVREDDAQGDLVGTITTDVSGEATILLADGTYHYTASKETFTDETGTFTVVDSDITVEFTMT